MRDDLGFADLPALLDFEEPAVRQPAASPRDSRLVTTFRVGKLATDRFEELCIVRHVGVGGMMAHVQSPLVPRQPVRIELRTDRKFWGSILWIKDGIAGIGFAGQVDIEKILDRGEIVSKDRRSSGPRLNIDCSAILRVGTKYHGVRIHDLGQHGVGISLGYSGRLTAGQEVVVTLEGFRPIHGLIVWYHNGRAGIAFNQPIAFHELTHWLQDMFGTAYIRTVGTMH